MNQEMIVLVKSAGLDVRARLSLFSIGAKTLSFS
jgi:hypothetical protein